MALTHRAILKEVAGGHVSDSPGIELYRVVKRNERGWNVYSVARGSSALEGFHMHVSGPLLIAQAATHIIWEACDLAHLGTTHVQLRAALQGFRVGAELCDSILLEMLVRCVPVPRRTRSSLLPVAIHHEPTLHAWVRPPCILPHPPLPTPPPPSPPPPAAWPPVPATTITDTAKISISVHLWTLVLQHVHACPHLCVTWQVECGMRGTEHGHARLRNF